jgi:hypothetical protein
VIIVFKDHRREPQCPPNPDYPHGIDVDLTHGAEPSCSTTLPYPALRCGLWIIECEKCGLRVAVTAAGRIDDPRSVKMPCKAENRKSVPMVVKA